MADSNFDRNTTNTGTVNPQDNTVRNWLAVIAVVLVILIAITYMIHRGSDGSSSMSTTSTSTVTGASSTAVTAGSVQAGFAPLSGTQTTGANGESIAVSDQSAGSSVTLSSMTLFRKSWVAVEAMDGSILGAGLFQADETSGTIHLLRNTVSGKKYEVVIYAASTGKSFDFHQDPIVVGSDGTPVGATFTAQ